MPTRVTTRRRRHVIRRQRHFCCRFFAIAALSVVNAVMPAGTALGSNELQSMMRAAASNPPVAVYRSAQTEAESDFLTNFYSDRDYHPAWLTQKRLLQLERLRGVARAHGLGADTALLKALSRQLQHAKLTVGFQAWAELEVIATLTVAQLACDLRYGHTDPTLPSAVAFSDTRRDDRCDTDLIRRAALSDDLTTFLDSIAPNDALYRKLQLDLATYRNLPTEVAHIRVRPGRILKTGMTDDRVIALRNRLNVQPTTPDSVDLQSYDNDVAAAVRKFQLQHRLDADGMLGRQTVRALNVTLAERIDQIRANMEWRRWTLNDRQRDYLLVNIAHYEAHLVRDGTAEWSGRIQVGRRDRQTPSFKTEITSIVANPTWTIPPTILRKDILPAVRRDANYLVENGLRVVDLHGRVISTPSINWQHVSARNFAYRVRAQPGPLNALGRIKFRMPNAHMVYIHDTPAKSNFDSTTRLFSSGCIRLENPEQLAERLLNMQIEGSHASLDSALGTYKTSTFRLAQTLPVIVTYNTIQLDESGGLIFGPDVYGRDAPLVAALDGSLREISQPSVQAAVARAVATY